MLVLVFNFRAVVSVTRPNFRGGSWGEVCTRVQFTAASAVAGDGGRGPPGQIACEQVLPEPDNFNEKLTWKPQILRCDLQLTN